MENLLFDKPESKGEVLKSVGYGTGLQNQPQRVLESEGFKEALAEIGLKEALISEGITPEKIAEKINVLLDAKGLLDIPDYTAVDKGLKHATAIYGITEDKPKSNSTNTYNFIFSPETQKDVKEIENRIKQRLIKNNAQQNQENN